MKVLNEMIEFKNSNFEVIKDKFYQAEKETIEEVSIKISEQFDNQRFKSGVYFGVKEGAKWQAERMYSEEDMINRTQVVFELTNKGYSIDEIIEQFKKK